MSIRGDNTHVIIAGASGLIGQDLLHRLNSESAISSIYALSRRPLNIHQSQASAPDKVHTIIDNELRVTQWDDSFEKPSIGFICLGTTLKQAGSKQALEKVDYDLVCHVAQTMLLLGVKRIAVVSSYGATKDSLSHYLKCKGKMEQTVSKMGFEQVVFMRPGPLVGVRATPRSDEKMLQFVMKFIKPLMLGKFANFIPIPAEDVAQAMLFKMFQPQHHSIDILNSIEMRALLSKYQ